MPNRRWGLRACKVRWQGGRLTAMRACDAGGRVCIYIGTDFWDGKFFRRAEQCSIASVSF